jgi:hypothetical protein
MKAEEKMTQGAQPYLEDDEAVLAAFVARPRGWTQTHAGSLHLGTHQQGKARVEAGEARFELASPMALAITPRRLLSLELGAAKTGVGAGDVKRLVAAVPLSEVQEMKVKRLLIGRVVTLQINGHEFKLETGAGANVKGVHEAFESRRAAVG